MALTLAELLTTLTRDQRLARLIAKLNQREFPVTDWNNGSVPLTLAEMQVEGSQDLSDLTRQITAGGLLDEAELLKDADGNEDRRWLQLLAAQNYRLPVNAAQYTRQRVRLWCSAGAGPYPITNGQLFARSPRSGRRYFNTTSGTVPAGPGNPNGVAGVDYLELEFQAESPGSAYNADIHNEINDLVTPLPGLSCLNVRPPFGGTDALGKAKLIGAGTGTITPSGSPSLSRTYKLTVTGSGQVTAGSGLLEVDDGSTKTTTVLNPIPASHNAGDSVTLTFANGAGNPSFIAGDVYTLQTPGSPFIAPGSDEEGNASLAARCRGRWPSLSAIPVDDKYVGWVKQCSIDQTLGVTKIVVRPSVIVPGRVDITIAGAAGAPPGSTVNAEQAYIDARTGIGERAVVVGAVNRNVTPAGTVTVRASLLASAQAQADILWSKYLGDLPIGGDTSTGTPGVVRLDELVEAVMAAGAIKIDGEQLNGAAADLALVSNEVAVVAALPSSAMTWLPVA